MKTYVKADVSEAQLEDLVRRKAEKIEEGLVYVDHQKSAAGGRLDVLMVDSGKSLVVAELKVIQDDGMLVQGLDYYDYVSTHVESFARLYKAHSIDPTQQVRLFLVAPDFSQTLVNRCKWFDLPISLFTFTCLKFEDDDDLIPIFTEREIPAPPEIVEVSSIEDHLAYITDTTVRANATSLLDEVKNWKPGNISLDPTKNGISMKVNNRVFARLWPRRQSYWIGTYSADDEWKDVLVKRDDDLTNVKSTMRAAMEKRIK
jgi:Endonuclease NucS